MGKFGLRELSFGDSALRKRSLYWSAIGVFGFVLGEVSKFMLVGWLSHTVVFLNSGPLFNKSRVGSTEKRTASYLLAKDEIVGLSLSIYREIAAIPGSVVVGFSSRTESCLLNSFLLSWRVFGSSTGCSYMGSWIACSSTARARAPNPELLAT